MIQEQTTSVTRKRLIWAFVALLTALGCYWAWSYLVPGELARGMASYARGDWPGARVYAERRLRAAPGDVSAMRLLARASARLGQLSDASKGYRRIPADALEAEDYYVLGAGLLRANQGSKALTSLETAIAKDPNHPEALRDLVKVYLDQERPTDAFDVARRLAGIKGWEAAGGVVLGAVHDARDERAAGADAFANALKADPSVARAPIPAHQVRLRLADDLLRTGRPAEARSQLMNVLSGGSDPVASFLLSRCYLQEGNLAEATSVLKQSNASARSPMADEPAPYVGSARCAECHQAIYESQQVSRHARTYKPAQELLTLALPDGPVADPGIKSVSHTISRVDGRLSFETRSNDGDIYRALVDFALGSGDRGLTLMGRDQASKMRELRLSLYRGDVGWDRTTGQPPTPHDPADCLGRPITPDDLGKCVQCHATNARAVLEQAGPAAADHGIGCERCHGPAGNHVAAVALGFPDLAIARPKHTPGAGVMALCGQCHRAKGNDPHPLNPEAIRFQVLTLAASACYANSEGKLDCVTCHNPHQNVSKSPVVYEAACLKCHGERTKLASAPRGLRTPPESMRRVACKVNPTSGCIGCHMPSSSGRSLHASFTDHYIRIHNEAGAKSAE